MYCAVLTCTALYCTVLYQVPNTELVRDLRWLDPRGEEVTQDTRSAAAEYRVSLSDRCLVSHLNLIPQFLFTFLHNTIHIISMQQPFDCINICLG